MAKEQNNHDGHSENIGDGNDTEELEQLSRSYAKFRRTHKPRMRIPEDLRKATLETVDKGVPDKLVQEACRVSPEQLNRWREIQRLGGRVKNEKKAKPRVFKVVDAPVEKREPTAPVQLRIGGWEICLRQIER